MATPERKVDPAETQWLSAAECAARTGLTVRALRVYERHGLIHPPRSAKGWRRYGAAELTRLNTIVILKALGLTLAQIKSVLVATSPSLLRILDMHAQSWSEKRAAADRALALVAAARARLRTRQELSIDELCDLIKRIEANRSADMNSPRTVTRALINEHTTPEEERAWTTWWAEHPEDAADAGHFIAERRAQMEEVRQLMQQGAAPDSPAAQELFRKQNELVSKYHLPERNRRQCAWNEAATRKWMSLGVKMARLADEKLENYWAEIVRASPLTQASMQLMLEVRESLKTQQDPAAAQFDAPVARLHEICATHGLGETLLYVEWRRFIGTLHTPYATHDLFDAEWEFMERALRARQAA
jgi:MerR family transcriptional regulator, thiopeptide resistance regulator